LYSACLFCHSALGANAVIEHFPVGRRLAFDAEKGRLWVICRSCERWNLTPLEERWEAIEECERLFRSTTLRMSTEHIGLARVHEGLELVRIGNPKRPEMAAWRYGDQFGKRRVRYYMAAGGAVLVGGAGFAGYAALGALGLAGGPLLLQVAAQAWSAAYKRHIVARVRTPNGVVDIPRSVVPQVKIVGSSASSWQLSIDHRPTVPSGKSSPDRWSMSPPRFLGRNRNTRLDPIDASAALAALLPVINGRGGSRSKVQAAVELVGQAGDATKLLNAAASLAIKPGWDKKTRGRLSTLPLEARLALEMATHEEDERRALDGELAVLEARWKEAEEIAAISDNMFVPASVTDWMQRLR